MLTKATGYFIGMFQKISVRRQMTSGPVCKCAATRRNVVQIGGESDHKRYVRLTDMRRIPVDMTNRWDGPGFGLLRFGPVQDRGAAPDVIIRSPAEVSAA